MQESKKKIQENDIRMQENFYCWNIVKMTKYGLLALGFHYFIDFLIYDNKKYIHLVMGIFYNMAMMTKNELLVMGYFYVME